MAFNHDTFIRKPGGRVQSAAELDGENHELRKLKNRLYKEHDALRAGLQTLKKEQVATAKQLESLKEDRNDQRKEKDRLAHELAAAGDLNKTLQDGMDHCREKIFTMQPQQQASEVDITEAYKTLCFAVDEWCERDFGDMEDLCGALKGLELDNQARAVVRELLEDGGEKDFVHQNKATSVHMVMMFLVDKVMAANDLVLGLNKAESKMVESIMRGMKALEPCRGKSNTPISERR